MKKEIKKAVCAVVIVSALIFIAVTLSGCMDHSDAKTPAGAPEKTADTEGKLSESSGTADPDDVSADGTETEDESKAPAEDGLIISDKDKKELENSGLKIQGNSIHLIGDSLIGNHYFGRYYGTYSGYAVLFEVGQAQAEWEILVAGKAFRHNCAFSIYAYKDGELYTLGDAYEKGLLTAEDITAIAAEHNKFERAGDVQYE